MELEKLNRSHGEGEGEKIVTNRGREANHKRLFNTENKQGGWGAREEGKIGNRH